MKTRSQSSFPMFRPAAAGLPGLRRGSPSPSFKHERVAPALPVDAAGGRPAREALRGLLQWLQRARALNSLGL